MDDTVKIAGMQMAPAILRKEENVTRCLQLIRTAAGEGARLVVFPEATLTGYAFASLEEALPVFEPVPGPSTERLLAACRELNVYVAVGLLEEDAGKYYNTALLLGPSGLIGRYRKLHLPFLGIDRFVNHGDQALEVYETDIGRIGMGICYDLAFPEHARVLTLGGADIMILITNWPGSGKEGDLARTAITRAYENSIYCVAVNRTGEEGGFNFFGGSVVADPRGRPLAEGAINLEDILYAEITPALARQKLQVHIPGEVEIDRVRDRRPEFYAAITEPLRDNSRIR